MVDLIKGSNLTTTTTLGARNDPDELLGKQRMQRKIKMKSIVSKSKTILTHNNKAKDIREAYLDHNPSNFTIGKFPLSQIQTTL